MCVCVYVHVWVVARFSAPVHTSPGAQPASYTMSTEYFQGVRQPGRDVDQPHHLALRLKKEYSYNSWRVLD